MTMDNMYTTYSQLLCITPAQTARKQQHTSVILTMDNIHIVLVSYSQHLCIAPAQTASKLHMTEQYVHMHYEDYV